MHKIVIVAAVASLTATLPQIAMAQSNAASQSTAQSSGSGQSTQSQSSQGPAAAIQSRVKQNLQQAGFKNIRIMPSSFLVRATDQDGNPVMMLINPDSVTEVTEQTGGERSSGLHPNGATGKGSEQINLTSAQRNEIWQSISSQGLKETPPPGFTPKVGDMVPSSLKIQMFPNNVTAQVPAVKSYDYAMLENQVLLVDPSSKKIVEIIKKQ